MNRTAAIALALTLTLALAVPAHALVGLSIKLGAGFIPDGSRPGGIVQADIGPLSPFAEFFKKSGVTTVNAGANLLLRLPFPLLSPYGGAGGGLSRTSAAGASRTRGLFNALAGADLKLPGATSFFGQIKYMYTFGSGNLVVREVAIQAGLRFYIGL